MSIPRAALPVFENQSFNYHQVAIDAVIRGPGWRISDELFVRPVADLEYTHQFGDDDYGLTSKLIDNTAQAVTIRSNAPAEDRFDAGIGAELVISEGWAISARYARQWSNDLDQADEAAITLRTSF